MTLSPHLQVQGGIKTTYQETPILLLHPFPHLAERVTPPPSIKLFCLTLPHVLLGFFHLEHNDQDLLGTTIADSKGNEGT
jgi:hypothetical protein